MKILKECSCGETRTQEQANYLGLTKVKHQDSMIRYIEYFKCPLCETSLILELRPEDLLKIDGMPAFSPNQNSSKLRRSAKKKA